MSVPSAFFLMRAISPCSASILSALLMDTSSRSGEAGLTTKSTAPARMALMAASIEPCAVCTMTGGLPGLAARRFEHLDAVDAGHDEIEQDQRDGRVIGALQDLERLLAALGGPGLEAETLDGFFEDAALGWIVVDDQDELGHVAGYSTQLVTTHAANQTAANAAQDRTDGHIPLTRLRGECPIWVNASFRFGLG